MCSNITRSFPGGSDGKESACDIGDQGLTPGSGRCPREGNETQTNILAWRIPWTEKPGKLQSITWDILNLCKLFPSLASGPKRYRRELKERCSSSSGEDQGHLFLQLSIFPGPTHVWSRCPTSILWLSASFRTHYDRSRDSTGPQTKTL